MRVFSKFALSFLPVAGIAAGLWAWSCSGGSSGGAVENCADRLDNDGDGTVDCVDDDCRDNALCQGNPEFCGDRLDNDGDGKVDCADEDCSSEVNCQEDCNNGQDDDGDGFVDCNDPGCKGVDPVCGEVCGDGVDNDGDGQVDCKDSDCEGVVPPCGAGGGDEGVICAYGDSEPHVCECADGKDNDGDGYVDAGDLHCFGPFDDDESSYATGIPGDNKGSMGNVECPFDGNSGIGNDWACCNPEDPTQNVTPNGCDDRGCCEIDVNGNGTGEHVYVRDTCDFSPQCGEDGKNGCPCDDAADCDPGLFCVRDDDQGPGFCSTCEGCTPNAACENTCECGEICFGGFEQPPEECGGGSSTDGGGESDGGTAAGCPEGVNECASDADCDMEANERCTNGCCYQRCPEGVVPCEVTSDCPIDRTYYCITGCCVILPN